MPRTLIPRGFTVQELSPNGPSLALANPAGHRFSVHAISASTIRVVHELPSSYPQKSVQWEHAAEYVRVEHSDTSAHLDTGEVKVEVEFSGGPRLKWYREREVCPFLADSETRAYSFDAASGAVLHYVERENHLPLSEDEDTSLAFAHPDRNEFIYGLGESRGSLEKSGKRFTMEGRDALSYSWEEGDPLYKVNPFLLVYNKTTRHWYGMYYNNLNDSSFDLGAEIDILWGCFRSYRASCGPLDYYVILGDGSLPSVLTSYASLISPTSPSASLNQPISASLTLPPLSQFGYLSSSLALAADPKAQEAVITFLKRCRLEGFPVDGLYLSSGWCQEQETDLRHYFQWNTNRYPTPAEFGRIVEKELQVQVIVNVKPWLLETHSMLENAEAVGAFVQAPSDALGDCSRASARGSHKSWVWGSGFASHVLGRYFDFSSRAGSEWWKEAVTRHILQNHLTGIWIDNNEMAGLVDDEATFRGEVGMFEPESAPATSRNVEQRMGWTHGRARVGQVGKAIQTAGMARATFEALLSARPQERPVIVSRSFVPGMQAFAHASWSGDNSTTWKALQCGTKMSLSTGLSFGPGLYGHDIGGFAGAHHPSPELLVRWCQNGAWHSRFTVHSWKETSTTLFMYNHVPGITEILRNILNLRYRLAPTFYSLYVTHYHRRGWPILKPLLWYHSDDPNTLKMDQDFIFGSHLLVASVVEKGARNRFVYLPGIAIGERDLQWVEIDTGVWHDAGPGKRIEMEADLSRTPVLARGGAILVLGGPCSATIYDGVASRTVRIFPSPSSASSGQTGSFALIEDDGRSNDHLAEGKYTEIELSFKANGNEVEVRSTVVHGRYALPYDYIEWELPKGDSRKLVLGAGMERWDRAKAPGRFCTTAPRIM